MNAPVAKGVVSQNFDKAVRVIVKTASDYNQLDRRIAYGILERFQVLAYLKRMNPEQVEARVDNIFGHLQGTYWWNPRECAIARSVKSLLMNICEEQKLPPLERASFKGRPVLTEFCRKNDPVLV